LLKANGYLNEALHLASAKWHRCHFKKMGAGLLQRPKWRPYRRKDRVSRHQVERRDTPKST
jgi:hypothetical protein